jgi:hypothetical protein
MEEASMRRIVLGTGILVSGLAALMWATATISAPHGGHGAAPHAGGGHAGGGGHAPAHVGSVHYGARAAPVPVHPEVRSGAVRSEHYEHVEHKGGYRNPYRDDYARHFRPGYRPFVVGDAEYYGYDSLPTDCPPVVLNGITYYFCDGVYYQPYIDGGQTVYLAVPGP